MKIIVADKIAEAGVTALKNEKDFEVIEAYGSTQDKIKELMLNAHAIIVRSETKVTSDIISSSANLIAIGRAGVGVDNVDVDAATERGIVVMNTPGGNTIATAELTFTHILCAARPIAQAYTSMKEGKWDRKLFAGSELYTKVLGILGLGRIGSEIAKRARAFGMRVLAYDPYLTSDRAKALEVEQVELDKIFSKSDYITIHMPKNDQTLNLINAESISKMKDGVRIINCARGGLVNESDLIDAVKSGKVAAAGLDVYDEEPLSKESKLRDVSGIVLSPHLGASTKEAQVSVGLEIVETIKLALKSNMIKNAVNMPSVDSNTLKVLRPYINLGEKLGSVLQQISNTQIEKLQITYWGKIVDLDAMPLTRSIQRGYLKRISGDDVNDINAPHLMKRLGVSVDIIKSNTEIDYNELIRVESTTKKGESFCVEGTLIGKNNRPRIVCVNGRDIDSSLEGHLLILENQDIPGIVGMVGTMLGEFNVNIANMSLSRNTVGDNAITILQLDSILEKNVMDKLIEHDAINKAYLVVL